MDSPNTRVIIRPAKFSDEAFIMASWLKGVRYGCQYFEDAEASAYFKGYADRIKKIFQTPHTTIDIGCLESDPGTIIGYVVYTGSTLHWIFVKSDYRLQGVARLLYSGKRFESCSTTTRIGRSLMKKFGLIFNPFLGVEYERS